jgi:midasin
MVELLALLQQTTNASFKLAIEKNLRPLCSRLRDMSTRQRCIAGSGLCWIAIANLIIDLFVPDAPIDPVAIQNSTVERWRFDQEMLSDQLSLHRELEEIMTGNSDSNFLGHLTSKLKDVTKKLSAAPRLPVRKDVSRLHMFWSEVTQFQNHILLPSKIEGLVVVLQRGEESAIQREQVLQQSMAGFCQRLDTVYTEYADLAAPLHLAILHMRVGLRLVTHSSNLGSDATSRTASALCAFPSVRSASMLCMDASTARPAGVAAFGRLLLTLSAIASEFSSGVSIESQMNLLDENYGQALRLWLIDRAKEKEINESSQSLYRRKNLDHDALSEAEIEENEFRALFPSFEEDLAPPAQPESHRSTIVHSMELNQLIDMVGALQGKSGGGKWEAA